jgi:hypothetical protein
MVYFGWAVLGWGCWAVAWAALQATAGLLRPGKPVSPSSFISVFLFYVFHFVNVNIVLNSTYFVNLID